MTDHPLGAFTYSQLNAALMCLESYHRRYRDHDRRPPTTNMVRGSAIDLAANTALRELRDTEILTPTEILQDIATDYARVQAKAGGIRYDRAERENIEAAVSTLIDQTAAAVEVWATDCAPNLKPKHIQVDVRSQIEGMHIPIRSIIDLVEVDGTIHDLKVWSKSPTEDAARESDQLCLGALAYYGATKIESPAQILDVIVVGKRTQKYVRVEAHNGPPEFQRLVRRLSAAQDAIRSGLRIPPSDGAWWCSEDCCEYYGDCPFVQVSLKARRLEIVGELEA